jgi:hypothetical protein
MTSDHQTWWDEWHGQTLRQGQFLPQCLFFLLPPEFDPARAEWDEDFPADYRDAIVLTQTCDLVPQGRNGDQQPRAEVVALCPLFSVQEFEDSNSWFQGQGGKREVALGRREGFYLLGSLTGSGYDHQSYVVDFHNIYSLPRRLLERHAQDHSPCLALRSPFLEHFSQALGHFFMRVGLPDEGLTSEF